MNEQKLRELLTAEMNDSAPAKDELWARIEGRLQPKQPASSAPGKVIDLRVIKALAAAAACVAVIAIIPAVMGRSGVLPEINGGIVSDAPMTDAADNAADAEHSDVGNTITVEPKDFMNYKELPFDSYSETIYKPTGTPHGESYFVEDDILAEADRILRGEVIAVYQDDDGSICYEMSVLESYPAGTESTLTVFSRSPYTMKRGREYLLPLTETSDGWQTVFDNVPQTEFTSAGGAVYYNGWSSLDTGDSVSLTYPESSGGDHFYDRMMYAEKGDITALVEKWETLERS